MTQKEIRHRVHLHLPSQNLVGEVLIDELKVVRLELFHGRHIIALGVQVIGVECPDSLQHLLVVFVHEVVIRAGIVPGVEAVVSDHGQRLIWQRRLLLDDMVQVLIMAPTEHDLIESTAFAVDAVLGAVDRVVVVLVAFEGIWIDDTLIEGTAHREGVANDVPLAFGVEEEKELAKVVNEASELHPARLAITTDSFCGLEQMFDLGEGGVGVGFVDERIQLLHGFPDGHVSTSLAVEVVASFEVVCHGLLLVLLTVEVLDTVAGSIELPELRLVLVGIELGSFVEVNFLCRGRALLDFGGSLQDVDPVDIIGHSFKSLAISLGVEGLFVYSRCHYC